MSWSPIINGQKKAKIYSPFRSGSYASGSSPPFHIESSPAFKIRGIFPKFTSFNRSMTFPDLIFADDGTTGSTSIISDGSLDESSIEFAHAVPLNSIHIDLKLPTLIDTENTADLVLASGLRCLRRLSRQYWIGQIPNYFDSYRKITIRLNRDYESIEEPVLGGKFRTSSSRTIPIDQTIWEKAWSGTVDDQLDWLDYALDAEHYVASNEISKSIIQMGLALESLKYRLWQQLADFGLCTSSALKDAFNNTSKPQRYFSEALKELTGHSVQEKDVETYCLISEIWIARGIIAHGKQKSLDQSIGYPIDMERANKLLGAVFSLDNFTTSVLAAVKK
jgi:hypothetical protein